MFFAKDHKTIDMSNRFEYLEPKRRGLLDTTWDNLLHDKVRPNLPVLLFSNICHLGRIMLFAVTITKFFRNLKRQHNALFTELPEELKERYLSKNAESAFFMVKPSDSSCTLEDLGKDLFSLVKWFNSHSCVVSMASYFLLIRLLSGLCVVREDQVTKTRSVAVRPNREVPSDSLQKPSDPDAGYEGHKGKSYQSQVTKHTSRAKKRPATTQSHHPDEDRSAILRALASPLWASGSPWIFAQRLVISAI
jgi:hypothetical protein